MEHYIYRHIRLDKNEPFYIGKGHNKDGQHLFSRAFSKKRRNPIWHNIASKTEFEVDILFTSESEEEINIKESEFINVYGRRNRNNGSLVNLTDGGDGMCGYVMSPEAVHNNKIRNLGLKHTPEAIQKMRDSASKTWRLKGGCRTKPSPVLQYSKEGFFIKEWKSYKDVSIELKISQGNISTAVNKKVKKGNMLLGGFYWLPKKGEIQPYHHFINDNTIIQYSLSVEVIKEWDSQRMAGRELGISPTSINGAVLRLNNDGGQKIAGGFYWKFKKDIQL